ncbi:YheC/YheD family protein [Bacillus kwashiorkori]|uniref:YheC/YheD family endospore coat-associated protein n=1 Tax=Bacillus kwashiorkori TaxID=1522318 RepID=UPI0007864814|nr:YheC/YheD family protein [Bacillus kwashiorkori]
MILYYNKKTEMWSHSNQNLQLTFGANTLPIPWEKNSNPCLTYKVHQKGNKVGPIVGIMVHQLEGKFFGNKKFVSSIAKKLIKNKCIPVIFSFDQLIGEEKIAGLLYNHQKNNWIPASFPIPDIIYNRINNRQIEQTRKFHQVLQHIKSKNIPFFNPHFLNKFATHLIFRTDRELKKYLPPTISIYSKEELAAFCRKWKTAYFKPRSKARGSGIFIAKFHDDGTIIVKTYEKVKKFHSFHSFWQTYNKQFIKDQYLAQKAIYTKKHKGRRYDFRVIAHSDLYRYIVIGIGVRVAGDHNITTHVQRGGKLISFDKVGSTALYKHISFIINKIGKQLTDHFGYFGEFSVDIGETKRGELYIFEVNAKPMSFDEEKIEEKRLNHLCQLFLALAKFQ